MQIDTMQILSIILVIKRYENMSKFHQKLLPIISDWSWIQKLTFEGDNDYVLTEPSFNLEGNEGF